MPFESERQRRFLHANHPEIAKRWERDYENEADILFPRKVRKLNRLTVAEKTGIVHEVVIRKALHREVAFEYQVHVQSVNLLI